MKEKFPYAPFDKFVFRCPLLPLNNQEKLDLADPVFKESIFLASPDLFEMINRKDTIGVPSNLPKMNLSLLKYQTRMQSRCTPFGLFAGCGVGTIAGYSEIQLDEINTYRTVTRLDMNYLCMLAQELSTWPEIAERITYSPNTSLYALPNGLRYVEYRFTDGKRKHYLSGIASNLYLENILPFAESGKTKKELQQHLMEQDIEKEEAHEFIEALIENQILQSELEPSITGEDILDTIINVLTKINSTTISQALTLIKNKLLCLDQAFIGRQEHFYEEIVEDIKKIGIKYDRKFLFQSDLSIPAKKSVISRELADDVKEGLIALSALSVNIEDPNLRRFKEEFRKKYEDEEIPLAEALDADIGIGFSTMASGKADLNPLIEKIPHTMTLGSSSVPITPQEMMLSEKYHTCQFNNQSEVVLTEEDIQPFPDNLSNLPSTIGCFLEIIKTGTPSSSPLILLKSAGGPSAARLLGRFCHVSKDLKDHVEEIISRETQLSDGKIVAEIVHLPESRTGNVLIRPQLRKYEIPYLAKSSVAEDYKISINDLYVSVKNDNTIKLYSRKLNKEVSPRLTTAHNYNFNSLPIYHFLCSMQADIKIPYLNFRWGRLINNKEYTPRVRYKNIILAPATWTIPQSAVKELPPINAEEFHNAALQLKEKLKLPDKVLLVSGNGDNKLLISFSDPDAVKLLFTETNKRGFTLEEFIFDETQSLIKKGKSVYTNQIILGFYKEN
jgi:hypothetical protein